MPSCLSLARVQRFNFAHRPLSVSPSLPLPFPFLFFSLSRYRQLASRLPNSSASRIFTVRYPPEMFETRHRSLRRRIPTVPGTTETEILREGNDGLPRGELLGRVARGWSTLSSTTTTTTTTVAVAAREIEKSCTREGAQRRNSTKDGGGGGDGDGDGGFGAETKEPTCKCRSEL